MRPLWPENWELLLLWDVETPTTIKNGQQITVSCAEGKDGNVCGKLEWDITEQDFSQLPCQKQTPCLFSPIRKSF
jgi:hypothetical protein